jgi:hypothetical protein
VTAYLDLDAFKARSDMPATDVDTLDARETGFFDAALEDQSRWIDSRLSKRYAVPFLAPYPRAVMRWLARLVTVDAYLKRGVDPNDLQFAITTAKAEEAKAEIKEAADEQNGLFELPLLEGGATAATRGGPLGYSEASPYVWTDRQGATGSSEDASGTGSGDGNG